MKPPTRTVWAPREARPLTRGPRAHFFGYFDKTPWDASCRRVLALEVEPMARMPQAGEAAGLGWIDTADGTLRRFGESRAWNWQQGCMLRWMPGAADTVLFNDRREGRFVAVIRELGSGAERVLPRNVFSMDAAGRRAACVDFTRLARSRPVVGYAGGAVEQEQEAAPADDGVWLLDLASGREELVFSLADAVALAEGPEFESAERGGGYAGLPGYEQPGAGGHRFEGVDFSPSGNRLVISHRWPRRAPLQLPHFQRHAWDRLVMLDLDTRRARLVGEDGFYSHHTWVDEDRLLAWARQGGVDGLWILDVTGKRPPEAFGHGVITLDTHCSISPDGQWLLGDSYPDARKLRQLWVCDLRAGVRYDVGAFASPPPFDKGPLRCDLHPRWRPDGSAVCIDGVHEDGVRQLYTVDVGDLRQPASDTSQGGVR